MDKFLCNSETLAWIAKYIIFVMTENGEIEPNESLKKYYQTIADQDDVYKDVLKLNFESAPSSDSDMILDEFIKPYMKYVEISIKPKSMVLTPYYWLVKKMDCYLYQCSDKKDELLYLGIEGLRDEICHLLVINSKEYYEVNWG